MVDASSLEYGIKQLSMCVLVLYLPSGWKKEFNLL